MNGYANVTVESFANAVKRAIADPSTSPEFRRALRHLQVNDLQPNALARTRQHQHCQRKAFAQLGLEYSTRATNGVDLVAQVRDCGLFETSASDFGLWDEVCPRAT